MEVQGMKNRKAILMSSMGLGLGVASLALPDPTGNTAQAACYKEGTVSLSGSCEDCEDWNGKEECNFAYEGTLIVHEDGSQTWIFENGRCDTSGGSCVW
jgi:hypothetical protein